MQWFHRGVGAAIVVGALVLAGCTGDPPSPGSTPSEAASSAPATSGVTASPEPTDSATPDGETTGTPSASASDSPSPSATTPATPAPASCTAVTPLRIARIDTTPRRTTEVVTLVSDGRNLTPGTREQNDFLAPILTGPDGTAVDDEPTVNAIALLVQAKRHRVLTTRPDPPDADASTSRRPFSSPGTYVLYNASSQLIADVVVVCSGEQQTWDFTAEADPSTGQVNCAVEPARSNALARAVYQSNCQ